MAKRQCYPVYAKGQGQVIHIMQDDWGGTGSTPSGLLAPEKEDHVRAGGGEERL